MYHSLPIIPPNNREPFVVIGATQLLPKQDPIDLLLLVVEPRLQMRNNFQGSSRDWYFFIWKGWGGWGPYRCPSTKHRYGCGGYPCLLSMIERVVRDRGLDERHYDRAPKSSFYASFYPLQFILVLALFIFVEFDYVIPLRNYFNPYKGTNGF